MLRMHADADMLLVVQRLGQGSLRSSCSPWAWTLCAQLQLGCQEAARAAATADKALERLTPSPYEPFSLASTYNAAFTCCDPQAEQAICTGRLSCRCWQHLGPMQAKHSASEHHLSLQAAVSLTSDALMQEMLQLQLVKALALADQARSAEAGALARELAGAAPDLVILHDCSTCRQLPSFVLQCLHMCKAAVCFRCPALAAPVSLKHHHLPAGAAKQAGPAAQKVYRQACVLVAQCSADAGSLGPAVQAAEALRKGGSEFWLLGLAGSLQLRSLQHQV